MASIHEPPINRDLAAESVARFIIANPAYLALQSPGSLALGGIAPERVEAAIAPLGPMSAKLLRLISVVIEIEASGYEVKTIEGFSSDETPILHINAGPELDGDEDGGDVLEMFGHKPWEIRQMQYNGCVIEWGFEQEVGHA